MFAHEHNEPGLIIQSHTPGGSAGVVLTPGNNTYGSYVSVIAGASVTDESYEILININSATVSGAARDCLVTIGIDYAGGTSFTDWIVDLCGAAATLYSAGGGIWYIFPLRVPAGASLGAKATVNNATVGTLSVQCRLRCRPSRPELVRVGSVVRTFGSTPASSAGTAITPPNGSDSAYVSLGTVAAGDYLWWWQLGMGFNQGTMNNNNAFYDLAIGDASNKRIVIADQSNGCTASESLSYGPVNGPGQANAGDIVYARAWGAGSQAAGQSVAAYGVGG